MTTPPPTPPTPAARLRLTDAEHAEVLRLARVAWRFRSYPSWASPEGERTRGYLPRCLGSSARVGLIHNLAILWASAVHHCKRDTTEALVLLESVVDDVALHL